MSRNTTRRRARSSSERQKAFSVVPASGRCFDEMTMEKRSFMYEWEYSNGTSQRAAELESPAVWCRDADEERAEDGTGKAPQEMGMGVCLPV